MKKILNLLSLLTVVYSGAFLFVTLHFLSSVDLTTSVVLVLVPTIGLTLYLARKIYSSNPSLVISLDTLDKREANLELFAAGIVRRARFSTKLLSLTIVYASNDRLLLYRLPRGEFKGEWQFLGDYIDPANREFIENPKLMSEYELRKVFNNDSASLEYMGSPTEEKPFEIAYSNPGINIVRIDEYYLPDTLLPSIEKDSETRIIKYANIEELQLEDPIALYVYDVLYNYRKVQFSTEFIKRLDEEINQRKKKLERVSQEN